VVSNLSLWFKSVFFLIRVFIKNDTVLGNAERGIRNSKLKPIDYDDEEFDYKDLNIKDLSL
jgi:hypothetical protein